MKLKELIPLWRDHKKGYVKQSTLSSYYLLIKNYILPDLGEMDVEDITNDVLNGYAINLVEGGLSKKSSTDICIVLKMLTSFSSEKFGTPYVKFKITYPSKYDQNRQEIEVYSDQEYKQIVKYVIENLTSRRLGILLSLFTGIRIGEMCALKWKNIDIDNKLIRIRETMQRVYMTGEEGVKDRTEIIFDKPKTSGSNRDVPIVKDLLPILKHLKSLMNENFFLVSGCEKACEPRSYRAYYKKFILEEVGLKRCIKFHGMRHSFASRMIAMGADLKTTSRILGHSNVSTTMDLYVHPTMDNKLDSVNKHMGKLFK